MVLASQLPPQNRQLIVYYYSSKQHIDGLVGGLTFENDLIKTLREISSGGGSDRTRPVPGWVWREKGERERGERER